MKQYFKRVIEYDPATQNYRVSIPELGLEVFSDTEASGLTAIRQELEENKEKIARGGAMPAPQLDLGDLPFFGSGPGYQIVNGPGKQQVNQSVMESKEFWSTGQKWYFYFAYSKHEILISPTEYPGYPDNWIDLPPGWYQFTGTHSNDLTVVRTR